MERAPFAYRVLLRLLPGGFRREFGRDLELVQLERLRDARGATARVWVWTVALIDLLTSAAAEWTRVFRDRGYGVRRSGRGSLQLGLDVRYAVRSLVRRPGFTATVVATLALGIGASIGVFSVVSGVLLRPLPFPEAGRIVAVETFWTNAGRASPDVSGPDFQDWRAQSDVFEALAAYGGGDNLGDDMPVMVDDAAVFANVRFVSAEFFDVFGQSASAGRLLGDRDVGAGEATVGIVAHDWAIAHFGSARAAVGRTVSVYGSPVRIVGVAAPGFRYPADSDLWAPAAAGHPDRSHHTYRVVGRLKGGVGIEQARAQLRIIGDELARRHPENRLKTASVIPLQERLTGDVRAMLWVLMGAVLAVLLVACANVSNMLLARGTGRAREVALRAALGASRGRVVRQLLTEGFMIAVAAALGGVLLALLLVRGLVALAPPDLPRLDDVRVDGIVLLFAVGLALGTTLLCALVPAVHASRFDLSDTLARAGARGTTSGRGARSRAALVVAEVALSVVLLAAAGLLLRSFQALRQVDLGFATDRVLVAYTEYAIPEDDESLASLRRRSRFYADLLDRLRSVPGVTAAAGAAYLPMGREPRALRDYFVRGRPEGQPGERPQAELYAVTPAYFQTLGIPLRAGRDFDPADAAQPGSPARGHAPVAIVNDALARTAFRDVPAVGQRIRTNASAPWMEIVGVVGDTRWQDPRSAPPPAIFVPSTQDWGNSLSILARTSLDEAALAGTLRSLLHDANPTVPVRFETMEALFAEAIAYPRFRARLIGGFAGLAAALAALGIFSVLAYLVAQRTREIAIRRAMGATTGDVVGLVLRQSFGWIAAGLALGLLGALVVARLLPALLFEISPWDPGSHIGGILVLGAAALLAAVVPAIRAATIPPLAALEER